MLESDIIPVREQDGVTIYRDIDWGSVVGRQVVDFSSSCGSYGMGGPGFVGFKLKETEGRPDEWLILCLWGAAYWLTVNDRWLEASPDLYYEQKPLISNHTGQAWDEFTPLVVGSTVMEAVIGKSSFEIRIGEAHIVLSENPSDRLPGSGPRELMTTTDLRNAWILASVARVRI